MEEKNHYEILGITQNASYQEIKKAYRQMAKQHHPDTLSNPTPEQQEYFARINNAYAVLSDLEKRRQYDNSLRQKNQTEPPLKSRYAGYPYFQYDIFTPYIHTFFMGTGKACTKEETRSAILLNYRTLLVAIVGALYFFKFFTAMSGTIVEKKIESGFFDNIAYHLILKTEKETEKTKRVKPELYDTLKVGDHIEKHFFSFTYKINDQETNPVTPPLFLLQTVLIYLFISGGLFFLEYARK